MKSSTEGQTKNKLNEGKAKTKKPLGQLMKDPTLEGKDENTIGRIQEKPFGRNHLKK